MSSYSNENHRLMAKRILEVLLVSSPYDLYIMEEEGLLADRISDEYTLLHLTSAPAITRVSTAEEAMEALSSRKFDVVITSLRVGKKQSATEMARAIKAKYPDLPVVLLTSEIGHATVLVKRREVQAIDKIFFWHGDTRLFLAIIKMLEDSLNAPHDCLIAQARAIILVEDSPHFYSAFLPLLYTELMVQTRSLIAEGATAEEKLLRMKSRPKILLAENYEEALDLFKRYGPNVLGIISDISFPRNGSLDPDAGFAFTQLVKTENPDMPVLLQSQDRANEHRASTIGASYADKNSPHLLAELRNFIKTYFGFGDFIFRMPDGSEICKASSLLEMEREIEKVPIVSIEYHGRRNHFSHWFFARGEMELAAKLKPLKITDFASLEEIRNLIRENLKEARLARQKMTIARFSEQNLDLSMPFMRVGGGSIGGKGRGIGFMIKLLSMPEIAGRFKGQKILVPQTAVIGTDVFDNFIERNKLQKIATEGTNDETIAAAFLAGELDHKTMGDLAAFLKRTDRPLAIRSSSLSEDSLSQPFAGIYTTYFIPNNHPDFVERLHQFASAIKLVFASTFFANPKAYMEANGIAVESEKMAVVVQQVVGRQHGDYYYPDIAGVAQSLNFFPVGYLKPGDGIAQLVMGLGTMAVRGERALRFCPQYPAILPQFGRARDIAARSQRNFHALNLAQTLPILGTNENATLASLDISAAEEHGVLSQLGGVYSPEDDIIYDGLVREGSRIVTFSKLLTGAIFPLPSIISEMLEVGSQGMGCPVEIEFAAELPRADTPAAFSFLQIRPLVSGEEAEEVNVTDVEKKNCIAQTSKALGNGVFSGIKNLIYIKPASFDIKRTAEIAAEIGRINADMVECGDTYVLLGFGRLGTTNPMLGIPVAYAQISHAKVIGEIATQELDVEPSQGTHFFHNIASARIGYLSIDAVRGNDFIDFKWLKSQPAECETEFIRHIKLADQIITRIDGRTGKGVILKP